MQEIGNNILSECKKGYRSAQEKLYRFYYSYSMSVSLPYTNSQDEAKEIVNDGFIKVFQNLRMFDEKKKFSTWLRRIMVNSSIDHYRKNKNHYHHLDTQDLYIQDFNDNVIDTMAAEEILHQVQNLPPAYRIVFNLYVLDGYKHHEIAKILNISIGASKSNLAKARNKLKIAIAKTNLN